MPFIAIIHIATDHTADAEDLVSAPLPPGAQWVGLFAYPARRELADHPNCLINGKSAWSRDRMGFMRCALCGKRNKRVRRFLIEALFDFLGANLYTEAPSAFRTPEGYPQ